MSYYKKILHKLSNQTCAFCHCNLTYTEELFCNACITIIPWTNNTCYQCAYPLHTTTTTLICGECQITPPAFQHTLAATHYTPLIKPLILGMKFQEHLHIIPTLAKLLTTSYTKHSTKKPECIIPIPLHKHRIKQRGFNQSLEISKIVCKKLNIKLDNKTATRTKSTHAQAMLNFKQRKQNVKNAFTIQPNNYQHVVILDDVVTTGNTVNELAKALKKSGVQTIDVWCIARAIL